MKMFDIAIGICICISVLMTEATVIIFVIDTFFTFTKNISVAAFAKSGLLNGMSFKMPSCSHSN